MTSLTCGNFPCYIRSIIYCPLCYVSRSCFQDLVNDRQKHEAMLAARDSDSVSDSTTSKSLEPAPAPVLITRSGRHVKPRGDAATLAALAPPQSVLAPAVEEKQLTALLETCEDENDRMAAHRALDEAQVCIIRAFCFL